MPKVVKLERRQFCVIYGFFKGTSEVSASRGGNPILSGKFGEFLHFWEHYFGIFIAVAIAFSGGGLRNMKEGKTQIGKAGNLLGVFLCSQYKAPRRIKTVADKPSFRHAFKQQRRLVPGGGFFEWKRDGKTKQPYYIRL